jgi:hypothetical protein
MPDLTREQIEKLITELEAEAAHHQRILVTEPLEEFTAWRAAQALRQLLTATEWKPLDTAPLDGTLVDLWVRLKPGSFEKRIPECSWGWIRKWNGEEYQGWIGLGHMHEERIPLAWRPYPLPPSPDTEGE